MPTSLAGKTTSGADPLVCGRPPGRPSGITLLEMVVVMAIIGLIAGLTWPAVASGIETVRLSSSSDAVAAFINGAINRSERRQEVVQLAVSVKDNLMVLHSTEDAFERKLALPEGITIQAVLPALESGDPKDAREFLLLPGGTPPRIGIEIGNRKGSRRIVRLDPITGVPRVESPEEKEK